MQYAHSLIGTMLLTWGVTSTIDKRSTKLCLALFAGGFLILLTR